MLARYVDPMIQHLRSVVTHRKFKDDTIENVGMPTQRRPPPPRAASLDWVR